jgi:hypothetical protein
MKKRKKLPILQSSDGYSFLEITVAMVIISIIGIIAWQGIIHVTALLNRIHSVHAGVRDVIMMEAQIRSEVSMIRVPFWMPYVPVRETDGEVRIGCYEGCLTSELFFRFSEGYLEMGCDNGSDKTVLQRYGPYEEVIIETGHRQKGEGVLISFSFYDPGSRKESLVISTGICSNPFVR